MPTILTAEIPRPKDSKEFEELTRDLFAAHWKNDNVQIYGRPGQGQKGVDVYGNPNNSKLNYGLQCKLRNTGVLEKDDILKEIVKARGFKLKLDAYIFITTAFRDKNTQDIVDNLSIEESKNGGFKIQIKFWEDICALLEEHRSVFAKYYKNIIDQGQQLIHGFSSQEKSKINVKSPYLLGMLVDVSSSMMRTIERMPKSSKISKQSYSDAINIVVEKAIAFSKTPEAEDVLPQFSLFLYGYGLGKIRHQGISFLNRIGIETPNYSSELIPQTAVRDLFSEIGFQESLPGTPNLFYLNANWHLYQKSIESQLLDVGVGGSILNRGLSIVEERFKKELLKPYFETPLLLIFSNGDAEDAKMKALLRNAENIKNLGVQIIGILVSDKSELENRTLYYEQQNHWSQNTQNLFRISSKVDKKIKITSEIIAMAKEKGWNVPDVPVLFLQLTQEELLHEIIEIILSPLKRK